MSTPTGAKTSSPSPKHRRGLSGITPRELKYIDNTIPLNRRHLWKEFSAKPIETRADFESNFVRNVETTLGRSLYNCDNLAAYQASARSIRDTLIVKWNRTQQKQTLVDPKRVYYLSLEYLMGRAFDNAMLNLGLKDDVTGGLQDFGFNVEDVIDEEPDAGLGNGGLGRLAACFVDSLATLDYPAWAYGIRYKYGIFKQRIINGYQVEFPDTWLDLSNPWEIPRPEISVDVMFYGRVENQNGKKKWLGGDLVEAKAYDFPVPGYLTNNVNTLRLWTAEPSSQFDFSKFNEGDYTDAVAEQVDASTISAVLYPNDNFYEGKELRLKQQYFWVAASLSDIVRRFKKSKKSWSEFSSQVTVQLNDTHPTLAVVELMRILIDLEGLDWHEAWLIITETFNYTNHTVLPEALEKWGIDVLGNLLPRHLEIIYNINYFFLKDIAAKYPQDPSLPTRVSLIEESNPKQVRMAYLAVIASHRVNGVAELHSDLIKTTIFKDFVKIFGEEKFTNVTNGITPRRWLLEANPDLATLAASKLGGYTFLKDLNKLNHLKNYIHDKDFRANWVKIKESNKQRLIDLIHTQHPNIKLNPKALFDIQVKRIHEYKRQQMNIFGVLYRYLYLKSLSPEERAKVTPRVSIFGGKSAPGYHMAKLIIHLINVVSDLIDKDQEIRDLLQVVFIEEYNVSKAQVIVSASDISEHISTAGTEASGTSNMKFVLNGGLIIGTVDGANIEIGRETGEDNVFFFGHLAESVDKVRDSNLKNGVKLVPGLAKVFEFIDKHLNNNGEFDPLLDATRKWGDHYLVNADFDAYLQTQSKIDEVFRNQEEWITKSIESVSSMGFFSSDRCIEEYAELIWNVEPLPVDGKDPLSSSAPNSPKPVSVSAKNIPSEDLTGTQKSYRQSVSSSIYDQDPHGSSEPSTTGTGSIVEETDRGTGAIGDNTTHHQLYSGSTTDALTGSTASGSTGNVQGSTADDYTNRSVSGSAHADAPQTGVIETAKETVEDAAEISGAAIAAAGATVAAGAAAVSAYFTGKGDESTTKQRASTAAYTSPKDSSRRAVDTSVEGTDLSSKFGSSPSKSTNFGKADFGSELPSKSTEFGGAGVPATSAPTESYDSDVVEKAKHAELSSGAFTTKNSTYPLGSSTSAQKDYPGAGGSTYPSGSEPSSSAFTSQGDSSYPLGSSTSAQNDYPGAGGSAYPSGSEPKSVLSDSHGVLGGDTSRSTASPEYTTASSEFTTASGAPIVGLASSGLSHHEGSQVPHTSSAGLGSLESTGNSQAPQSDDAAYLTHTEYSKSGVPVSSVTSSQPSTATDSSATKKYASPGQGPAVVPGGTKHHQRVPSGSRSPNASYGFDTSGGLKTDIPGGFDSTDSRRISGVPMFSEASSSESSASHDTVGSGIGRGTGSTTFGDDTRYASSTTIGTAIPEEPQVATPTVETVGLHNIRDVPSEAPGGVVDPRVGGAAGMAADSALAFGNSDTSGRQYSGHQGQGYSLASEASEKGKSAVAEAAALASGAAAAVGGAAYALGDKVGLTGTPSSQSANTSSRAPNTDAGNLSGGQSGDQSIGGTSTPSYTSSGIGADTHEKSTDTSAYGAIPKESQGHSTGSAVTGAGVGASGLPSHDESTSTGGFTSSNVPSSEYRSLDPAAGSASGVSTDYRTLDPAAPSDLQGTTSSGYKTLDPKVEAREVSTPLGYGNSSTQGNLGSAATAGTAGLASSGTHNKSQNTEPGSSIPGLDSLVGDPAPNADASDVSLDSRTAPVPDPEGSLTSSSKSARDPAPDRKSAPLPGHKINQLDAPDPSSALKPLDEQPTSKVKQGGTFIGSDVSSGDAKTGPPIDRSKTESVHEIRQNSGALGQNVTSDSTSATSRERAKAVPASSATASGPSEPHSGFVPTHAASDRYSGSVDSDFEDARETISDDEATDVPAKADWKYGKPEKTVGYDQTISDDEVDPVKAQPQYGGTKYVHKDDPTISDDEADETIYKGKYRDDEVKTGAAGETISDDETAPVETQATYGDTIGDSAFDDAGSVPQSSGTAATSLPRSKGTTSSVIDSTTAAPGGPAYKSLDPKVKDTGSTTDQPKNYGAKFTSGAGYTAGGVSSTAPATTSSTGPASAQATTKSTTAPGTSTLTGPPTTAPGTTPSAGSTAPGGATSTVAPAAQGPSSAAANSSASQGPVSAAGSAPTTAAPQAPKAGTKTETTEKPAVKSSAPSKGEKTEKTEEPSPSKCRCC